jgi:hypothetical protein
MEKFLLKSAFGTKNMKEMLPGDVIKVACQTWLECNSVKVLACNQKNAYPRPDISKYETKTEKQGNGYIVTVTAVS